MSITLWLPVPSSASRLSRSHLGESVFVDLDHVTSRVCATCEAFESLRSPRDDRMGVGAGLDRVALFDLLVEKDVEPILARPERVDLSHAASIAREANPRPSCHVNGGSCRRSKVTA